MNPDELKQAWQSQSPGRLTIDADLLLKEVRRNQRFFAAMIFWRDVRKVGVAVLLVPVWLFLGIKSHLPWAWYLTVPALVWIAGFMIADRLRNKPHRPGPGESLRQSAESSLVQVDHQIWLLRNVFWWYLLPLGLSILAFFAQSWWRERAEGWLGAVTFGIVVSVAGLVFAFIYWLNQMAVHSELEPRRHELAELLANLQEEPPVAVE